MESVREHAGAAIEACGETGDALGLAWAWSARAMVHRRQGYFAAAADAAERAARWARDAGRRREEVAALRDLAAAIEDGPAPISESIERCRTALQRVRGERPVEQEIEGTLALLLARAGRADEARELATGALAGAEKFGLEREIASCLHRAGRVELLAGGADQAERTLRRALGAVDRLEEGAIRARIAACLAHVAYEAGREQEALELAELAERAAAPDDVRTQVEWRTARAKVLAKDGRTDQAKVVARQAVQLAEQTDLIELRAGALLDVAEVLRLFGRPNEASPFARKARRMLERKGAHASAARARAFLERFDPRYAHRADRTPEAPAPS
jgi:ATP/maltotriose-dependent transcriptional regulator MalT